MMVAESKEHNSEVLERNDLKVVIPETKGTKIFGVIIVGFLIFVTITIPLIFGYEILMGFLGHRSHTMWKQIILTIVVIIISLNLLFTTLIVKIRVQSDWKDDIFSHDKVIYNGEDFSWQEIDALYMNPDEEYVTILFRELYGPGYMAGTTFGKKSIDPSPEAMKEIAMGAGINVFENDTLNFVDLLKIKKEKLKNEK